MNPVKNFCREVCAGRRTSVYCRVVTTKPPARLLEFLDQQQVWYQLRHHPTVFTAQELAAVIGVKGRSQAKVVLVTDGDSLWMTVLPADHRLDFAKLESGLGRPVQLAREDQFRDRFPDCAVGAAPPFGNLYDLPTILDQRLAAEPFLVFAAGTHTDGMRVEMADYQRLAQPQVADIACKPTPMTAP